MPFRRSPAKPPREPHSIFQYVLMKLEAWKGRWREVSEGSGVSLRTLEKIARGETEDPGVKTVEKLANFFRDKDLPA